MKFIQLKLFALVILFITAEMLSEWTFAETKDPHTLITEMETILAEPYQGTPENYLVFAAEQGKKVKALADDLLNQPNLTRREKEDGLNYGSWGTEISSYQEDYLTNVKEFLEAHQDIPETKSFYRSWILRIYNQSNNRFKDESRPIEERIADFRETVSPLLPFILRYNDTERESNSYWLHYESNLSFPYVLMKHAQLLDPDGAAGLYIETVKALKPIFEEDIKYYEDLIPKLVLDKSNGVHFIAIDPTTGEEKTDNEILPIKIEADSPLSVYQEKKHNRIFLDTGGYKRTDDSNSNDDPIKKQTDYSKYKCQESLNNAYNVLGIAHRFQMTGQPMEYDWVDIKGNPISIQNYRGKVVLLVFLPFKEYREYRVSRELQSTITLLKTLYQNLKSEDFELITHDMNCEFDLSLTKNSTEDLYTSETLPWKTVYRLSPIPENHSEYGHLYGVWNGGVFLIDREGKVIATDSDLCSPKLLEKLKNLIPQQTNFISQFMSKTAKNNPPQHKITPTKKQKKVNPCFDQLYQFHTHIHYPSDEKNLELINLLLTFPDAIQSGHLYLFNEKALLLSSIAMKNAKKVEYMWFKGKDYLKNISNVPPETFYAEYDQYIDELIQNEEIQNADPYIIYMVIDNEYKLRQNRINDMCDYLKCMSEGQEEYAAKILAYYVRIYQHKNLYRSENEKKYNIGGYSEWSEGIEKIAEVFQEVDAHHGTHLAQQLNEALIAPVLEKEGQNAEKE